MKPKNYHFLLIGVAVAGLTAQQASAQPVTAPPPAVPDGSAMQPRTVPAQDASGANDRAIQDIVVTARKRAESLMSVPVAVTAVSAAQIQKTGVTDISRLAQLAPQVQASRADSGSGAGFTIRGLGTPFADSGTDQSVAVNIDGVQASRGNIVNQGFFDLEQVEVLKGPQALFFGKNSPAGVISLRSVGPSNKLEGYVRAGYEFDAHERYGEAAIGGPITDTLKARIAIRGSEMRGWLINTAVPIPNNPFHPAGFGTVGRPGKGNGGKDILGRLTVVYTPSSRFDATLKFSAGNHKDNGSTAQTVCLKGGPVTIPTVNGIQDPTEDCNLDKYYTLGSINPGLTKNWPHVRNGEPYTDTFSALSSLTMNYHFDNITLTSVSGYLRLKNDQSVDFTGSSYVGILVPFGERTTQLSQELRLTSSFDSALNFTIGAYYEHVKRDQYTNGFLGDAGIDPITGKYETYDNFTNNKGRTLSAFGQLRWQISGKLELAGGVRYSNEKKSAVLGYTYENSLLAGPLGLPPVGPPGYIRAKFSGSNWSPEATLSYKPSHDTLIYGAFKTGFKSGGISNPNLIQSFQNANNLRFNNENAKGFEAGVKTMLADRTIRIEATAYSYLYKGLQVSSFDQNTFSYFIKNAASARIKGVELQAEWRATRALSFNGSATYNSARYLNFPTGQCYSGQTTAEGCINGTQDLSGHKLTHAPAWTFAAGANYDIPLGESMSLGLNADMTYTSKYQTSEDQGPVTLQPEYSLFNAGIRLFQPDNKWELAFIGRNLANKFYMITSTGKSFATPYEYLTYTPRARELRLQATYRF